MCFNYLKLLKNTDETIEWFKSIDNKMNKSFIQIDIVDYYPSVSEELFEQTLQFAEQFTTINNDDKNILRNARKSILFYKQQTWEKQTGLFDITMGAYDGAQITDLVGLMLLQKLKENIPEIDFGLYRDDGLGIYENIPLSHVEKIKKIIFKTFKDYGLKITIEANLPKVNFLDVNLNLRSNSFQPYRKPNDKPLYINSKSNHPPHVISNLPTAINKRLSEISSSEELFNENKKEYEDALNGSGYKTKLNMNKINPEIQVNQRQNKRKRNRNRKTIWYNPPYNMDLKTNIGKTFFKIDRQTFS